MPNLTALLHVLTMQVEAFVRCITHGEVALLLGATMTHATHTLSLHVEVFQIVVSSVHSFCVLHRYNQYDVSPSEISLTAPPSLFLQV